MMVVLFPAGPVVSCLRSVGDDLHIGEERDLFFNHVSLLSRVVTRVSCSHRICMCFNWVVVGPFVGFVV